MESSGLWKFGKVKMATTNGLPHTVHGVIATKIRYLVLCYGVPLKITNDPSIKEPLKSGSGPHFLEQRGFRWILNWPWLPLVENKGAAQVDR